MRHVQKTLRMRYVEDTLPRQSECDMCREENVWVLSMRYMSTKRYLGAQTATFVDKTRSRCSEWDTCRRNAIQALRMWHMLRKHSPDAQNAIPVAETNIRFATSDCLCEIVEKIKKMNIGFVTTD